MPHCMSRQLGVFGGLARFGPVLEYLTISDTHDMTKNIVFRNCCGAWINDAAGQRDREEPADIFLLCTHGSRPLLAISSS